MPGAGYDPTLSPDITSPLGLYNDTAKSARPTPGLLFFHPNHLGSTALVTDAEGVVQTTIRYKPYGEVIRDNEPDPKLAASSGPDSVRYKYTAQEEDPETSLMYYNARYYDPAIGRFVSADSIIPDIGSQGHNRYMYVGGNPISYSDPSGHEPFLIALLIGGMLNGMSAVVSCGCSGMDQLGAFFGGFAVGALSGAAGFGAVAGLGVLSGSAFAAGLVGGVAGGAVAGFGNALLNGTDPLQGMFYGALMGGVIGGAMGLVGDVAKYGPLGNLEKLASSLFSENNLSQVGYRGRDGRIYQGPPVAPRGNTPPPSTPPAPVSKFAQTLAKVTEYSSKYLNKLNESVAIGAAVMTTIIDPSGNISSLYNTYERVTSPYTEAYYKSAAIGRAKIYQDNKMIIEISGLELLTPGGRASKISLVKKLLARKLVTNGGQMAPGAMRAAKWGTQWSKMSLSKALSRHAGPNSTSWVTNTGKRIFENPATGRQVVQDIHGGYFRIFQPNIIGGSRGKYLDMMGNVVPKNRQDLSHFLIRY